MRKFAFVILAMLSMAYAASSCAADTHLSPQQVLAHPGLYNGKAVSVTGTIQKFRDRVSHHGNAYETFELCDNNACLHVFAWGNVQRVDGNRDTLSGHFWAVKHVGSYTFYDELDVGS